MTKFEMLCMDCEKFFDEFKLFSELVHELSTFEPTVDSINAASLKKYLEWLNFLWTEYAYLYNGTATSAYRINLKSEGSQKLCYDNSKETMKEMAKLKNAEKDTKRKTQYKSILEGLRVRFDAICVDIGTCQKKLKESADFIFSRVKE